MENWENFEDNCFEYLRDKYQSDEISIVKTGGLDSTMPDIMIMKNGQNIINVETKSPKAQSGQFVLIEDSKNKKFCYSPKNKTRPNKYSDMILEKMNDNYDKYSNVGTNGITIDVTKDIINNWIVSYYIEQKKSEFIITEGEGFIIFPTIFFNEYFNATAIYRVKKSGSSNATKEDMPIIKQLIEKNGIGVNEIRQDCKKVIASLSACNEKKFIIESEPKDFFFSLIDGNDYYVTKLSNTKNANVIFSIELYEVNQKKEHLYCFEAAIKNKTTLA